MADSGPGIPAEKRAQIFEPFTQLDSTDNRRYGGVGLGLAVVAGLCKQLGGRIHVDDVPQGAQFTLEIPYASPEANVRWLVPPVSGAAALLLPESTAATIFENYLREAGLSSSGFVPRPNSPNGLPPPPDPSTASSMAGPSAPPSPPGARLEPASFSSAVCLFWPTSTKTPNPVSTTSFPFLFRRGR